MIMRFNPKEENFPDDILCPLCKNYGMCSEDGRTCKTIEAMQDDIDDMEE
jgi:hypothetical protein